MANIEVTDIDTGSVEIQGGQFFDELLTLEGADTILKGTILARSSATGKLVLFVAGGNSNENGIPKCVLTYEVVATEASDVPVRVLVAGTVNRNRLVIDADGDASNVTDAVADKLRDYHIVAVEVSQIGRYDNPQDPADS
jgi:hypothetical protein